MREKSTRKSSFFADREVILDTDLAELYGVEVRHLNQQVKRNAKRFPPAFRFQLSAQEFKILRSQNVISSEGHGGTRYRPYAFTEHGAIMAATVLNSERAIEMSVFVVLAFVRMRRALATNRQVLAKLAEVERRLEGHDADIQDLMDAIRELITHRIRPAAASASKPRKVLRKAAVELFRIAPSISPVKRLAEWCPEGRGFADAV